MISLLCILKTGYGPGSTTVFRIDTDTFRDVHTRRRCEWVTGFARAGAPSGVTQPLKLESFLETLEKFTGKPKGA